MAGKLPQPDFKSRAFFAWNTNCVQCSPKRLLFHSSPAAIKSLNYIRWLTEDYLRARHSWWCQPLAPCLDLSWTQEGLSSDPLGWGESMWVKCCSITVKISWGLWRHSNAKPAFSSTSTETSGSLSLPGWRLGRGPGTFFMVCIEQAVCSLPSYLSIFLALRARLFCRLMPYPDRAK